MLTFLTSFDLAFLFLCSLLPVFDSCFLDISVGSCRYHHTNLLVYACCGYAQLWEHLVVAEKINIATLSAHFSQLTLNADNAIIVALCSCILYFCRDRHQWKTVVDSLYVFDMYKLLSCLMAVDRWRKPKTSIWAISLR